MRFYNNLAMVRFCSCVDQLSFTLYLCSVAVHSRLNWFALVIFDCSRDALQPTRVHYEFELYSGICTSICPLAVMYVELLASRLAWLHLYICMYEGAVMSSQYQTMVSAMRVVIPTRLTIVRSMLYVSVYKENKRPSLHSLKLGLKRRSSEWLSNTRTCFKFR